MASSDQFQPPPTTRRQDFREILHGVEVPDPYRWLEDGDALETRAWLSAQQKYARPFFDTPIRERIRARLAQLMKIDAMGFPIERKGYYFYSRRRADEQHSVICRRNGLHGQEEVLVDANTMSADQMTGVLIVGISRDGSILTYGVRHGGEDEFSINLMEVASQRDLQDRLPRARYLNASWKHDGSGFYYVIRTEAGPRVRFHRLGARVAEDREVVGSNWGPERWASALVSDNGRYLTIGSGYRTASTNSGDRNDLYVQQLDPEGARSFQ
jgi:prolyl oligopeptidase